MSKWKDMLLHGFAGMGVISKNMPESLTYRSLSTAQEVRERFLNLAMTVTVEGKKTHSVVIVITKVQVNYSSLWETKDHISNLIIWYRTQLPIYFSSQLEKIDLAGVLTIEPILRKKGSSTQFSSEFDLEKVIQSQVAAQLAEKLKD